MTEKYSSGKYIFFKKKKIVIYLINRLTQHQKLFHIPQKDVFEFYSEDPNWSYLNQTSQQNYDMKLYIDYDESILFDGFHLAIESKEIFVRVSQYRGVIFALNELENLFNEGYIEEATIHAIPTIENRGIIEGFYGTPWSQNERFDMIDFLIQNRMNTYFYAPKDDLYHRKKWRIPYPLDKQKHIVDLIKKANDNYINFVFCISPGNDIDLCNQEEIRTLSNKLLELNQYGVTNFAILFDDINYDLNDKEKSLYSTPGIAHSFLANKVYDYIKSYVPVFKLYICPTEYFQNWDTPYRNDIKNTLYKDIDVFFTGYNTIAKQITKKDYDIVFQSFRHKIAVWDNFPTNDVNKDRLFLGPIINRTKEINSNQVSTYVSNPMNQWQLSKISLKTIAKYLWDSQEYNDIIEHRKAIKELSIEWNIPVESLHTFVKVNQSSRLRTYYEDISNCDLKKTIDDLHNIRSDVYLEMKPWIDVFQEEVFNILKENRTYNLGNNFHTKPNKKGEL